MSPVTPSLSALHADVGPFLQRFVAATRVFPFAIESVLTDDGSELKRHFSAALVDLLFNHGHTFPRRQK